MSLDFHPVPALIIVYTYVIFLFAIFYMYVHVFYAFM